MPREAISIHISDLAGFARRLRTEIARDGPTPGHARYLGHLARAVGYANWQHLLSQAHAPQPSDPPIRDSVSIERAVRAFDPEGRLARWPGRTKIQELCLWVLWSRLPSRRDLTEAEVDAVLKDGHAFGDHVLLRRSLVGHGLASREPGGSTLRRVERRPPIEALLVMGRVPPR